MSVFKTISVFTVLALLMSCNVSKSSTKTYWVNSMKTDCNAGSGKMQCLQVSENETIENAKWLLFYSTIKGFNFEPGIIQKIEVKVTELDQEKVPADASFLRYELVEILEKKQDPRMALNDIWAATHVNRKAINAEQNVPSLEINISQMKVFGCNGCNNYNGEIKALNTSSIRFGAIASTRKMCPNMTNDKTYDNALSHTHHYKKEGLNLTFYDENNTEILRFKKVD